MHDDQDRRRQRGDSNARPPDPEWERPKRVCRSRPADRPVRWSIGRTGLDSAGRCSAHGARTRAASQRLRGRAPAWVFSRRGHVAVASGFHDRRSVEDEHLGGVIVVGVVVAHERQDLAAGQQLDAADEVVAHGGLELPPDRDDEVGFALVDQATLALGHVVLGHADDRVVADRGAGLGGPAAGVVGDEADDEPADGGVREPDARSVCGSLVATVDLRSDLPLRDGAERKSEGNARTPRAATP